mmetsp:Transcript_42356/g.79361  ORF Transcript_42356/g.79361 Transcript_42356/m.79361 type:complete len:524 (+) Transcript_42356:64-1635(+)
MGNLCAPRLRKHARQCCGVSRTLCCGPGRRRTNDLRRKLKDVDEADDIETAQKSGALNLSYDMLEVAFAPGTQVWFTTQAHKAGGIVTEVCYQHIYGDDFFRASVEVLVSDGDNIKEDEKTVIVPFYLGHTDASQLPLHRMTPSLLAELTKRGEKFRQVALGAHHMQYDGLAFMNWGCCPRMDEIGKDQRGLQTFRAEGRVMVDAAGFARFNGNYGDDDGHMAHRRRWLGDTGEIDNGAGKPSLAQIPDEDLWRTWPTVKGFSFFAKRWGEFFVEALEPIKYRIEAVQSLVMDGDRKKMVLAMVKHAHSSFSDVVEGKGGGCIFLLHGPPGVGKTLTAEATSEVLRKPLYSLTVGELGSSVESMEKRLRDTLELAELWDAILLIDECDIFLERRDSANVQRNAMTGIFLRLLEYHRGVLFMTSNRIDSFDPALYSRITVSLHYPSLDFAARVQVWQNMLSAAGLNASKFDVETLAKEPANGRQIKNAVRFAQVVAQSEEAAVVTTEHCCLASRMAREFNPADA